jgi:hypothetical protein
MTPEQQTLLKRYLKLFNSKLRDCAFIKQSSGSTEEIEFSFESRDVDSVIAIMSECNDSSKTGFFNALTEFALILLLPPKPLVNKTISVTDYVEKLLKSD